VGFAALTGLYIYLVRKHAPYKLVLGVLAVTLALGVVCLAIGIAAHSQPIYIYYPLFIIGSAACASALFGGLKARRYYREIELRKMRAMDIQ